MGSCEEKICAIGEIDKSRCIGYLCIVSKIRIVTKRQQKGRL